MLQLGLAERALGRTEQAQYWLERARDLDPDSSLVHFYLAEVAYNRGLNDEALASLERALALNPENYDALYLMGFVLGDLGRQEEARAATTRAIQLNPTLSRAQANLSIDHNKPERYEALVGRASIAADGGGAGGPAGALQPRVGVPAEGLLSRGAAGVPAGARPRRGRGSGASRRWRRCTW